MRLSDVIGSVIPVNSHSRPRTPAKPPVPVPVPAVGVRFGGASAFSFSAEGAARDIASRKGGGVTVNFPEQEPPEFMRVVTSQVKVVSQVVRVEDPDDPESFTDVDRLARMMFYYTQFPPKPTRGSLQPSFTTYYDLHFDLHPTDETVVGP